MMEVPTMHRVARARDRSPDRRWPMPKPFPPEPFRSPGALLEHEAIVRKDRAEDGGRRPDPLTNAVSRLPRRLGYNLGP